MSSELSPKDIERHNQLYKKGWKLIQGEIQLWNHAPLGKPGWQTRRKLKQAISRFRQTLEIAPGNWNSMWALGKIYERFDDYSTALDWFLKANQLEPDNADILREGALRAAKLGKGAVALEMARTAVQLKPAMLA